MSGSRLLSAFEPLAATARSGFDESVHYGAVVCLASDGSVALSVGSALTPVFPRSAMKPLQAAAMVECGLDLPPQHLALVCSSHDGRDYHVAAATAILEGAGLGTSALRNTHDLPLDGPTAASVVRAGGHASAVQMNCSGKHSGMLATCVAARWPTETYLEQSHPLQVHITSTVEALTGEKVAFIAVDGCGAPAHALSLLGLARAFRTIALSSAGPCKRVADAMRTHPEMVGGPTRDVTLLMQGLPGAVVKDGAEGVMVVALPDGRTVAMKVADGANRARGPVAAAALAVLGVDVSAVNPAAFASNVMGHGKPVGVVRAIGRLGAAAAAAAVASAAASKGTMESKLFPLLGYIGLSMFAAFIPVIVRGGAVKRMNKFNNVEPRWLFRHPKLLDDTSADAQLARCANAAHENGNEQFMPFAVAIICAFISGMDRDLASKLAFVHICARLAFNYVYMYMPKVGSGFLRSACFGVGLVCTVWLLVASAIASAGK